MVNWNSSPHPISDIRDWSESGRLELRPDFQRRAVWSAAARTMLMDTILRGIPMPKIFLATTIRDESTYRMVIDGQQRISAILDFLRDRFSLDDPFKGPEKGKRFSDFSSELKNKFLSYKIDFNEALNASDQEIREVYSRVNKYTFALTKQELRKADFPGEFLDLSEELSVIPFFDVAGVFTATNRRRYADVEYLSELLAAILEGIQDKKATLDEFYIKYSKWSKKKKKGTKDNFKITISEIQTLFDKGLDISKTRFRQKADFYTLFLALFEFSTKTGKEERDLQNLREDLKLLDYYIRPESSLEICREYAIKCVSQANSASSRRWRHRFIRAVLSGTYGQGELDPYCGVLYYQVMEHDDAGGYCPSPVFECDGCQGEISGDFTDCVISWLAAEKTFQISNAGWAHRTCAESHSNLRFLERSSNHDQPDLF